MSLEAELSRSYYRVDQLQESEVAAQAEIELLKDKAAD